MEDRSIRAVLREKGAGPSIGIFEFAVLPRVGEGVIVRGKEHGEEKYVVVNIDHRPARAGTLGQVPEVIVVVARDEPEG